MAMPDFMTRGKLLMVLEAFPGTLPGIGSVAKKLLEEDILPASATDSGPGGFHGRLRQPPAQPPDADNEAGPVCQW